LRELHAAVRRQIPRNDADRRQDGDILTVLAGYRAGAYATGPLDFG